MSFLQIILILSTVVLLAAGQILFKMAAEHISFTISGILPSLFSVRLISAVTIYSLATGMWLMVLKDTPLRLAYPFFGLSFVVVPILSHYLLGENLNWNVFLGAAIICIGVWVSILH